MFQDNFAFQYIISRTIGFELRSPDSESKDAFNIIINLLNCYFYKIVWIKCIVLQIFLNYSKYRIKDALLFYIKYALDN